VHEGPLAMERDERRTAYFHRLGIRVIRFENRLVFESLELVLNAIRHTLKLPSSAEARLSKLAKTRFHDDRFPEYFSRFSGLFTNDTSKACPN
jgi:hypothetical protein